MVLQAKATEESANAQNDALRINELYNTSLKTTFQNLQTSALQAANTVGKITLEPLMRNLAGHGNFFLSIFKDWGEGSKEEAATAGEYIGKALLGGIGNVIGGPGIIYIARLLTSAAVGTGRELFKEMSSTLSGKGDYKQLQVMTKVNEALARGTAEEQRMYFASANAAQQQEIILGIIARQNALLAEQAAIYQRITAGSAGSTRQPAR